MTADAAVSPRLRAAANCLEVEDLSVRLKGRPVLNHLTFAVPTGSALAVIGPNGAGKTVLFRALIGALPHEGQLRWAPRTRIGYVPQKLDIERDLPITGADFLEAKACVSGVAAEDVTRALALVRMDPHLLRRSLGALSGGQFQRLLVAAALVGRPTVLLLDEPTAGVDETGQELLHDMIDRLRRDLGLTVLLISHDLNVVARYASQVLGLGRSSACAGAPETILTPALLEQLYGTPLASSAHGWT